MAYVVILIQERKRPISLHLIWMAFTLAQAVQVAIDLLSVHEEDDDRAVTDLFATKWALYWLAEWLITMEYLRAALKLKKVFTPPSQQEPWTVRNKTRLITALAAVQIALCLGSIAAIFLFDRAFLFAVEVIPDCYLICVLLFAVCSIGRHLRSLEATREEGITVKNAYLTWHISIFITMLALFVLSSVCFSLAMKR